MWPQILCKQSSGGGGYGEGGAAGAGVCAVVGEDGRTGEPNVRTATGAADGRSDADGRGGYLWWLAGSGNGEAKVSKTEVNNLRWKMHCFCTKKSAT